MSSWVHVEGYIITSNPDIILKQIKRVKLLWEYWESPWFSGSEGNAEIKKIEEGLSINGDLRDCDIDDFNIFMTDFQDILKQCDGVGFLKMSCSEDIKQIECYEKTKITEFKDGYHKYYTRFKNYD